MTEEQIVKNFDEVNATFTEFIKILPFIELRDIETFDGKRIKLRTQLADESLMTTYTAAMIFFELQYMLHSRNNRMDVTPVSKMLVSNLMLTPIIPNSTFRRGFMIEIEYIK